MLGFMWFLNDGILKKAEGTVLQPIALTLNYQLLNTVDVRF